jgi:Domain of unknown function (DUF4602)
MKRVETYVCPSVRLPDEGVITNRRKSYSKRPRDPDSQPYGVVNTTSSGSKYSRVGGKGGETTRHTEMDGILSEIKQLSSTRLEGLAKKKSKDDVLTRLGVPPPKQQTMPFAMRVGIEAGRKKRQEKYLNRAKESGLVIGRGQNPSFIPLMTTSKEKEQASASKQKREDFDVKTRSGVLHVKKDRSGRSRNGRHGRNPKSKGKGSSR